MRRFGVLYNELALILAHQVKSIALLITSFSFGIFISGCHSSLKDRNYYRNMRKSYDKIDESIAELGLTRDSVVYVKYYLGSSLKFMTLSNSVITEYYLSNKAKVKVQKTENKTCQEAIFKFLDSTNILSIRPELPIYPEDVIIHDGAAQHMLILSNSDTLYDMSFNAEHREFGDSLNLNMKLL